MTLTADLGLFIRLSMFELHETGVRDLFLSRPTQSIIYVPLQVNRFQKSILLIIQCEYLKSCSGDFILQDLILRTKSIMQYWFYYSI